MTIRTSPKLLRLVFLGFIVSANASFKLQIIHNNDCHAKFEQTNARSEACSDKDAKEGKCYGGFARTKTAIDMALQEAKDLQIPSILVNPGDFFVGTPYYALKKWELVVPMVNALNFKAIALGNHEFDDGIDNVIEFIKRVEVPVLCCNLDLDSEPRLKNLENLKPSIEINIQGTRIGIIGSLTYWTMEYSQTEDLIILPEIPSIQKEARKMKADGIDIIILLSHSEFKDDKEIAEAVPELSLIVGSHSHTLLHNLEESEKDKPRWPEEIEAPYPYYVELPSKDKVIPLVQAYAFTKYLGNLIVTFDGTGNVIRDETYGNTVLLDASIPEDVEMKELVEKYIAPLRKEVLDPIAYTRVPLSPVDFSKREFESTLANLVTEALVDFVARRSAVAKLKEWTSASIALLNIGGYFHDLGKYGKVSLQDMMDTFRNGNFIVEVTYAGSVIKDALEYSMIPKEGEFYFPNFLHVAGMRVLYDLSKPINHRVESIEVLSADSTIPRYEKMQMDQNYRVVLPKFLWVGGQGFKMFKERAQDLLDHRGMEVRNVVQSYIERKNMLYPIWDGRVTVKNINAIF